VQGCLQWAVPRYVDEVGTQFPTYVFVSSVDSFVSGEADDAQAAPDLEMHHRVVVVARMEAKIQAVRKR